MIAWVLLGLGLLTLGGCGSGMMVGPDADPAYRDNYLARFARVNLLAGPDGEVAGFCEQVPERWEDLEGITKAGSPEEDAKFGSLFRYPALRSKSAEGERNSFTEWRAAAGGSSDAEWAIPTVEELRVLFTNADGEPISLSWQGDVLVAYVVKSMPSGSGSRTYALRFEYKVGLGLEVRARVDDGASPEGVQREDYWDVASDAVRRYFPALGLLDGRTDPAEQWYRGDGSGWWSCSPFDGMGAMGASFGDSKINVDLGLRSFHFALRPFTRDK
ncbi:MAG: hypothetical protein CSA07_01095 [Bacteroidia bacterium]|nr:MAG: hypothetical protein CSA07_01095 [Bacteroidia bacterium]